MTKEFEGSGRGKKRNQKMKPFLVYQYLMRHTDENHVITGEDICSAMADIYGIEAERRGIVCSRSIMIIQTFSFWLKVSMFQNTCPSRRQNA